MNFMQDFDLYKLIAFVLSVGIGIGVFVAALIWWLFL